VGLEGIVSKQLGLALSIRAVAGLAEVQEPEFLQLSVRRKRIGLEGGSDER
jgi:hypothetical protein